MRKREEYVSELQQSVAQHNGMLRPEDVVEFAKSPATALHTCFTWDDTQAAHNWRLVQARQIIRVSVIVSPGDPKEKVRAFVSLKENRYNDEGYRSLISVMSDGDLRQVLLTEAMMEMQSFMDKYENLKELASVFAEMQKVVKRPRKSKTTQQPKYRRAVAAAG